MNPAHVLEKDVSQSSVHVLEEDIARRWWTLPRNAILPLTDGNNCQLIYPGRPAGPAGPDIRDAILSFSYAYAGSDNRDRNGDVQKTTGDVEIHIRATDWFSHQHHTDKRYNNDVCLIPALAERLGYGRDRAFFRAIGLHLIGAGKTIPEPLGHSPQPSPLDKHRLHRLHSLVGQWRTTGAWELFRQILLPVSQESADLTPIRDDIRVPKSQSVRLQQLRNMFQGLATARTDILLCNIVLPFAVAIAQQENCSALAASARKLYQAHPGLSSNQVTRAMRKRLLLESEPKGACQQQGLQHIERFIPGLCMPGMNR